MGTDIKLKDLFGQTQTEQDISTVSVPKADGTGREFFVKRPVIYYKLVASPPYAPQEGDNTIIFWNLGDGGFGTEADNGNCLGGYHEAVEGKTTKPIISITVSKYMEGIAADNSGNATVLYLYEALAGSTLLELAGITGTADFTAQPGWGQLIQGADGQTYTYTQLTDLSGIAIGIEQPNNILNQRLFYSYLTEKTNSAVVYTAAKNGAHTIVPPAESSGISAVNLTVDVPEPNLQDKSVEIAENGTQEFSADTGYDGIKKFTAKVNVAGGGGTGVQPDYAQNNSAAADYIKNRPGGYMIEYPSITKTFTATSEDPNFVVIGGTPAILFTTDPLPNSAILNATGKVTVRDSTTTKTENIGSIVLMMETEESAMFYAFLAGGTSPFATIALIKQVPPDSTETISTGVYFIASQGVATENIQNISFTSAAAAEPAVIDKKYLALKPSNWGIPSKESGNGYISSRIGGFWGITANTWKFDGDLTGKETIQAGAGDYKFIKISDDAVPLDYAARAALHQQDFGSDSSSGLFLNRDDITLFTDLVGHPMTGGNGFVIKKEGAFTDAPTDQTLVISVQTPYVRVDGVRFTQGTWFLYRAGSGGAPAHYISEIGWNNGGTKDDHIVRMPYEFVEQHPNALTTDAQTLTDAQKLQARTNIGLTDAYINALIDAKIKAMQSGS